MYAGNRKTRKLKPRNDDVECHSTSRELSPKKRRVDKNDSSDDPHEVILTRVKEEIDDEDVKRFDWELLKDDIKIEEYDVEEFDCTTSAVQPNAVKRDGNAVFANEDHDGFPFKIIDVRSEAVAEKNTPASKTVQSSRDSTKTRRQAPKCGRKSEAHNLAKDRADGNFMRTREILPKPAVRRFTCRVCHASFAEGMQLLKHSLLGHNPRVFVCTLCGRSFECREYLDKHTASHKRIDQSDTKFCLELYRDMQPILQRYIDRSKVTDRFACDFCPKRFRWNSELQRHKLKHVEKHSCVACDEKFRTKRLLRTHQIETHGKFFADAVSRGGFLHPIDLRAPGQFVLEAREVPSQEPYPVLTCALTHPVVSGPLLQNVVCTNPLPRNNPRRVDRRATGRIRPKPREIRPKETVESPPVPVPSCASASTTNDRIASEPPRRTVAEHESTVAVSRADRLCPVDPQLKSDIVSPVKRAWKARILLRNSKPALPKGQKRKLDSSDSTVVSPSLKNTSSMKRQLKESIDNMESLRDRMLTHVKDNKSESCLSGPSQKTPKKSEQRGKEPKDGTENVEQSSDVECTFVCSLCNKRFPTKNHLTRHWKYHTTSSSPFLKLIRCDDPGLSLSKKRINEAAPCDPDSSNRMNLKESEMSHENLTTMSNVKRAPVRRSSISVRGTDEEVVLPGKDSNRCDVLPNKDRSNLNAELRETTVQDRPVETPGCLDENASGSIVRTNLEKSAMSKYPQLRIDPVDGRGEYVVMSGKDLNRYNVIRECSVVLLNENQLNLRTELHETASLDRPAETPGCLDENASENVVRANPVHRDESALSELAELRVDPDVERSGSSVLFVSNNTRPQEVVDISSDERACGEKVGKKSANEDETRTSNERTSTEEISLNHSDLNCEKTVSRLATDRTYEKRAIKNKVRKNVAVKDSNTTPVSDLLKELNLKKPVSVVVPSNDINSSFQNGSTRTLRLGKDIRKKIKAIIFYKKSTPEHKNTPVVYVKEKSSPSASHVDRTSIAQKADGVDGTDPNRDTPSNRSVASGSKTTNARQELCRIKKYNSNIVMGDSTDKYVFKKVAVDDVENILRNIPQTDDDALRCLSGGLLQSGKHISSKSIVTAKIVKMTCSKDKHFVSNPKDPDETSRISTDPHASSSNDADCVPEKVENGLENMPDSAAETLKGIIPVIVDNCPLDTFDLKALEGPAHGSLKHANHSTESEFHRANGSELQDAQKSFCDATGDCTSIAISPAGSVTNEPEMRTVDVDHNYTSVECAQVSDKGDISVAVVGNETPEEISHVPNGPDEIESASPKATGLKLLNAQKTSHTSSSPTRVSTSVEIDLPAAPSPSKIDASCRFPVSNCAQVLEIENTVEENNHLLTVMNSEEFPFDFNYDLNIRKGSDGSNDNDAIITCRSIEVDSPRTEIALDVSKTVTVSSVDSVLESFQDRAPQHATEGDSASKTIDPTCGDDRPISTSELCEENQQVCDEKVLFENKSRTDGDGVVVHKNNRVFIYVSNGVNMDGSLRPKKKPKSAADCRVKIIDVKDVCPLARKKCIFNTGQSFLVDSGDGGMTVCPTLVGRSGNDSLSLDVSVNDVRERPMPKATEADDAAVSAKNDDSHQPVAPPLPTEYRDQIIFRCAKCMRYVHRVHIIKHVRTCDRGARPAVPDTSLRYRCALCKNDINTEVKSSSAKHRIVHDEFKHYCRSCTMVFCCKENVDRHAPRCKPGVDWTLNCKRCKKGFYRTDTLIRHVHKAHDIVEDELSPNESSAVLSESNSTSAAFSESSYFSVAPMEPNSSHSAPTEPNFSSVASTEPNSSPIRNQSTLTFGDTDDSNIPERPLPSLTYFRRKTSEDVVSSPQRESSIGSGTYPNWVFAPFNTDPKRRATLWETKTEIDLTSLIVDTLCSEIKFGKLEDNDFMKPTTGAWTDIVAGSELTDEVTNKRADALQDAEDRYRARNMGSRPNKSEAVSEHVQGEKKQRRELPELVYLKSREIDEARNKK